MKIGFIGAGNMGGAILRGYVPYAEKAGDELSVYVPTEEKLNSICKETGAAKCSGIDDLVRSNDVIIIGVKPNMFEEVLPQVAGAYNTDKVVVSMAAGVTIEFIEGYLGKDAKIVRIMPNTPAQVRAAMIAVCRNANVDDATFEDVKVIFDSIGKAEEVDEDLIHCVIGVSGSSPAYTFMYIDALMDAAVKNGMDRKKARVFAAQSVLGAAKMVLKTDIDPEQLCINVCSPGGTTIEAVESLKADGFEESIEKAFQAAVDKSKDMSK
ncbi:MAG: pyrroline-5-carboxylate reductase [Firmicutes bacterium]|nr:pyrroline-5-carboxylate reductase [Bacillota bacterium]